MTCSVHARAAALAIAAGLSVATIASPSRAGDSWRPNAGEDWWRPDANNVANLSAQWWQLVFSVPTAANPLTDATGKNCMVGNRGPVWFLYGNFLGGTTTRSCTIPQGKRLFVVVYNSFQLNAPNICGQGAAMTVDQERAAAAQAVDGVSDAHVTLDHVSIDRQIIRRRSPVFEGVFPADNLVNGLCAPTGFPGGVYSPGVADGLYVVLQPLSVGSHRLHVQATAAGPSITDVTYMLTVVPAVLK